MKTSNEYRFFLYFQVAWLKVDTQTILTIHNHVITKNNRIGVSNSERNIWHLHIKDVRESDQGWYMCQINTDPMKSQVGYLTVVGKFYIISLLSIIYFYWTIKLNNVTIHNDNKIHIFKKQYI